MLVEQARLLETVAEDHVIALVTARSDWIDGITLKWILEHGIRWDLLIMRSSSDYRRSTVMKQQAVRQMRTRNYQPVLAIDDDPRNVTMFEREGIPCIFIPSGYHGSARQ